MPTANQIAQAEYQAWKSRQPQGDMPPLVAGQPVATPEEGQAAADIAGLNVPSTAGTIRGMVSPQNLVTTAAEVVGSRFGVPPAWSGRAAQHVATAAQRLSEGKQVFGEGYGTDLATNFVVNEVGNVLGKGVGYVAGKIGQSAPVQAIRSAFAKRIIGKITPDARAAYDFTGEMIDDAAKAVNAVRSKQGKPLYSRDEVEKRLSRHVENLKARGAFTIPDVTTGGLVDALEPLAEGSIAGKGTFASKRSDQDALLNEWPKVWAAMLGDERAGPDDMAALAAMSIEGSLRNREGLFGNAMQQVENVVGKHVVDIQPDILDPLERQIALYAKLNKPSAGKGVKIDPEGVDQHVKSAIGLVERATGKKFNMETGEFTAEIPKELEGMAPSVIAAMQAQGVLPQGKVGVPFTFSDVKTLRGNLQQMASKLPSGEKRQADAVLTSMSEALKSKMYGVLDAEDALAGKTGATDSLRNAWKNSSDGYAQVQRMRDGFDAKGWIEALQQGGNGRDIIPQIWPDNADANRVVALKDLMGGESSPYWQSLRRFKAEDLVSSKTKSPEQLMEFLTDNKLHSLQYWHETLGKDQYERLLKFSKVLSQAGQKNPFAGEAGVIRRVDASFAMRFANPDAPKRAASALLTAGAAGAAGMAGGAAMAAGTIGGVLLSARKVAHWLTNPEDSAMFLHIAQGKPLTMKAKTWLRNNVGRALADASKDEQPDIVPIPASATRDELRGLRQPQQSAYSGVRG